jgi:hypothetical protein
MGFNPLDIFNDKVKSKPIPRGPGGKFVSAKAKPKEEVKEAKEEKKAEGKETKETAIKGPYPITFYGHEIRRYYKDKAWYFSLDDIAQVAYLNSDDPTVRKGDAEKLTEGKDKCAIKIEGVEFAKGKDIAKLIPFFKGNMPGPITSWLLENSESPLPQEEPKEPVVFRDPSPMNPSDVGR